MRRLLVCVEIGGVLKQVGHIDGGHPSDAVFRYDDAYLSESCAAPVSVNLPLQTDAFSAEKTRNFFEGLLPEGFTRRSVAKWMHADETDYLSILAGLGSECLGAVCILMDGAERPVPGYERISDREVAAIAREGATTSAQIVTKAHLSLTGASGKVGLYFDDESGTWYLPKGTAPSTHIVKQSHVRMSGIVANEQLSLLTARELGMEVPDSFIINLGEGRDEEVLFATRRFDRKCSKSGDIIDGLHAPLRLHQEDFAQALGMSSVQKYEDRPDGYMRKMFSLLRTKSADPVQDQLRLWDLIVFNFLIGNADAHLKNVSLLYDESLKGVRLAPFYDILSTSVYDSGTRDMAVYIGEKCSLDEITPDDFRAAADEAGLGQRMAMRRFDLLCGKFEKALHTAADTLSTHGFVMAHDLEEQILATGGCRRIL
ncbi:MAG: HipA domain-containing protein [Lachnospiraceae bacterium]|nr:HipA domain-containing protein [Lachnospiraceae bacterium]